MRAIALLLLFVPFLQDVKDLPWTEEEAFVTMGENQTLGETRRAALNEALRKAVEKANGVQVSGKTVLENSQVAVDLVQAFADGLIVDQQIIDNRPEVLESAGKFFVNWKVRVKAKVTPPRVVRHDPNFRADITLGKSVFTEGENLVMTVTVTRDAYIHVFNVGADGAVTTLVPNRFHREKLIRAGTTFRFPPDEQQRQGIRLTATLPTGAPSSEEKVTVIATRRDVDLVGTDFQEAVFKVYDPQTTGLITSLNEKLSRLSDADWFQDVAAYRIFKR
ncbi:MAG: DUF4384 domain-containing protein [Acidimicrobiia bacterium]|nr:DUF4384 domain-containing protein [Acidimicrobiia bacterium]